MDIAAVILLLAILVELERVVRALTGHEGEQPPPGGPVAQRPAAPSVVRMADLCHVCHEDGGTWKKTGSRVRLGTALAEELLDTPGKALMQRNGKILLGRQE